MKFNDFEIKILGRTYQICKTCRALYKPVYSCEKCRFIEEIPITSATIKDNDLIHTFINPDITWLDNWPSKVLALYKPLFFNYKNLYDGYLQFF